MAGRASSKNFWSENPDQRAFQILVIVANALSPFHLGNNFFTILSLYVFFLLKCPTHEAWVKKTFMLVALQ